MVKKYLKTGVKNAIAIVKQDPAGMAKKALHMAKYLHGIINSELKSVTNYSGVQYIHWNGTTYQLTDVTQGDHHDQRNGMSILAKYLTIQGAVKLQGSTTTDVVTIYVILDTQREAGTAPNPNDLLETIGGYQVVNSMLNVNNRGRFKILKKLRFTLNKNGAEQKSFSVNIKSINKHVKWQYSSTNEMQNHIYMMAFSDHDPTDTGNIPRLDFSSRFKFYDN